MVEYLLRKAIQEFKGRLILSLIAGRASRLASIVKAERKDTQVGFEEYGATKGIWRQVTKGVSNVDQSEKGSRKSRK